MLETSAADPRPPARRLPSRLEATSEAPARLLLVEDDDGDALLVTELLEESGSVWDVVRARSVAEATAQLTPGIDCVLLDLGLPDAQGLDAVHAIVPFARSAAVVCLTGLADEHRGAAAVAAGAQDYLVKDQVDANLLVRALRYSVERRRADEQSRQLYATQLQAAENARLERGLLPQPHLRTSSVRVTTRYRPGRESVLGGDFFDVVETADGTVLVLVGDVAGHGPDEAALGVSLRIAWRTLVLSGTPVERLLPVLQDVLVAERRSPEVFTTVCMVALPPGGETALVWLAGHHSPLLLDPPRQVPAAGRGPALGLLPQASWTPQEVELPSGWRMVLYTDGWVEGRVGDGPHRLGVPGLLDLAGASPAAGTGELLDDLLGKVMTLNGGDLTDDVAVVAIEDPGAPPAESR